MLFYLVYQSLMVFLLPGLALYVKKRLHQNELQKKINVANLSCFFMLILTCLTYIFFGSYLFEFFKIQGEGYTPLLILVCLSMYTQLLAYLPVYALADLGYYAFITKINCLNLFLMVLLGIVLVREYGAYGIAIANLTARIICTVITYHKVSNKISLRILTI